MHLLIPFAAPLSEAGRHALGTLALPALESLLARLSPAERDSGDEYQLSPPHERVLAREQGWVGADGALPFAAAAAAADGVEVGRFAWGLLSPVHWQVGRDALTMGDPDSLALDASESQAFFEALRALYESEGFVVAWGAPTRWYVSNELLAELPTASLDRVVGRNPDLWMPEHPRARLLKRLQNEVQMLLYTHALNDAREQAGREPLNSVWLSGCGRLQPARGSAPLVLDALRGPALREDWAGWAEAWRALDAGPLREALARGGHDGEPFALTLCGERGAQSFELKRRGIVASLRSRWQRPPLAELTKDL